LLIRFQPVLRIRDVYPGSRILIFTHPGSQISDPGWGRDGCGSGTGLDWMVADRWGGAGGGHGG